VAQSQVPPVLFTTGVMQTYRPVGLAPVAHPGRRIVRGTTGPISTSRSNSTSGSRRTTKRKESTSWTTPINRLRRPQQPSSSGSRTALIR
jgi:hypothetical protein